MDFKGTKEYPSMLMRWHIIGNGIYHINENQFKNQIGCLPVCRVIENKSFFKNDKEIEANKLLISNSPQLLELHQTELKSLLDLQQTMYDREVSTLIIQEVEQMIFNKEKLIKQATEL